MRTYSVLVVDDSIFMRKIITDLIQEDGRFRVIDTARNGREAVEKNEQLRPDVITLDIEMPEMNGLEALQHMMAQRPVPVVMLSSLTEEGAKETIQALEWGAVDFVRKPSGSISLDLFKVKQLLLEKLQVAVQTNVRRQPPAPPPAAPERPAIRLGTTALRQLGFTRSSLHHLVALGTSTGGPKALQQVLASLPAGFPAPIVIVQHMPPRFTKSLADRLDTTCRIRVVEAEDGDPLQNGVAYIAPGGMHMIVCREESGYCIRLTKDAPRSGHRPSVDTLFESLLAFPELKRHIVLMTGMGSDGARSMKQLRETGAASTIAESADTCVVYGMPRAAAQLQAVMHQLPLHQIASKLLDVVGWTADAE